MASPTIRIEFSIPPYNSTHVRYELMERIQAWANKFDVKGYDVYAEHYVLRVEFVRMSDYTLFALCWQTTESWDRFKMVRDLVHIRRITV